MKHLEQQITQLAAELEASRMREAELSALLSNTISVLTQQLKQNKTERLQAATVVAAAIKPKTPPLLTQTAA